MPTETRKPERPLMPKLAASASAISKSPITPRLAGSPARIPPQRGLSTPSPNSGSCSSNLKGSVSPNITPRSTARRSRVDTTPSNPNNPSCHTPTTATRPSSTAGIKLLPRNPPGRCTVDADTISVSDLDPSVASADAGRKFGHKLAETEDWIPPAETPSHETSYFFRAADTKSQAQQSQRPTIHKKSSSFVYANGNQEHAFHSAKHARDDETDWDVLSASSGQYNSGNANVHLPSRTSASSLHSSNIGSGSRSPTKGDLHLSYRKGASQIMRPNDYLSSGPIHDIHAALSSLPGSKPLLPGASDSSSHHRQKNLSLSSIESASRGAISRDATPAVEKALPSAPFKEHLITSPSLDTMDRFVASPDKDVDSSHGGDRVQSPSPLISNGEGHRPFNGAAANARRERKVLDLEISNSSLLAINRSLEKEVRKQKAEIRRLRRLSRNTHHSNLISDPSFRESLGYSSDVTEDNYEGDESMHLVESEDDPTESLSELTSPEEDLVSPEELEKRDARHRRGDQWRLRMDLLKHREFLADSQRVNQSLKMCLGVTEQLVRDGTRALEYQVRTVDVPIGGRVLSTEDGEQTDTELSLGELEEDPTA